MKKRLGLMFIVVGVLVLVMSLILSSGALADDPQPGGDVGTGTQTCGLCGDEACDWKAVGYTWERADGCTMQCQATGWCVLLPECSAVVIECPPAGCQSDDDCAASDACHEGKCNIATGDCYQETIGDGCLDDLNCPQGNECQVGVCTNCFCSLETIGDGCLSDDDCPQGNACQVGVCTVCSCSLETIADCCLTDGECDDSDICTDDSCVDNACVNSAVPPRSCYTGDPATKNVGICMEGTETCSGNSWGECVGQVLPGTEVCDGVLDEDCDGSVDEGCACINGETRRCGKDVGVCAYGEMTCINGQWGFCEGNVSPGTEICDGLDNNCNGQIDEGNCCVPPPTTVEPTPTPAVEVLEVERLPVTGEMPLAPALPTLPTILSSLTLIGSGLLLRRKK